MTRRGGCSGRGELVGSPSNCRAGSSSRLGSRAHRGCARPVPPGRDRLERPGLRGRDIGDHVFYEFTPDMKLISRLRRLEDPTELQWCADALGFRYGSFCRCRRRRVRRTGARANRQPGCSRSGFRRRVRAVHREVLRLLGLARALGEGAVTVWMATSTRWPITRCPGQVAGHADADRHLVWQVHPGPLTAARSTPAGQRGAQMGGDATCQ